MPTFNREGFALRLLDLVVVLALGGIWLSFFFARLKARSILPANDPRLQPELAGAAAHD